MLAPAPLITFAIVIVPFDVLMIPGEPAPENVMAEPVSA
jgi:hypothetical protein